MSRIFSILICFHLMLFSACTQKTEELTNSGECPGYVELNYSNYNSLSTDPITIIKAKIDGDCLVLTLQYGGGCKEHQVDLALILPECGTPPLPPTTFEIRHNAKGDACKALVTKDYSFDISGIREEGKNKIDFIINHPNSSEGTNQTKYTYYY